jgi:hypothetical protein
VISGMEHVDDHPRRAARDPDKMISVKVAADA